MESAPPRKRPRGNAATTAAESAPIPSTSRLPPPASDSARAAYTPTPQHQLATLHIKLPPAYLPPQTSPTAFQLPTPLTSFSYSPTRELLTGERRNEAMAEYREPELGADLNQGFEKCCWRDGTVDEGLDGLLDALESWADLDETGQANELLSKTHVITWRGMMTKLLLSVYEVDSANGSGGKSRADGWEMNAMIVDNTLYLEDANSPEKSAKKVASEASYLLQSYYGYSFESFATHSDSSSSIPGAPNPIPSASSEFSTPNTNVQWCSVVKTNLGGFRSIIGGEVDCVMPAVANGKGKEKRIDPKDFVELKTNIIITSQRDEVMFERTKLLKHYIQSFLLGVPLIIVGFRTRPGILSALQRFNTLEIPRLVRGKPHSWDPLACLAVGKSLLSFIHSHISTNPATKSFQDRFARSVHSSDPSDDDTTSLRHWPVFRIKFKPAAGNGMGECTIRLLDEEKFERDVIGGKREGIDWTGFLKTSWIDSVRRRRRAISKRESTAPPPVRRESASSAFDRANLGTSFSLQR